MHREEVDLASVVPPSARRAPMVTVGTAGVELNGAGSQAARFALDPAESAAVVDDEVVANVFTEWHQDSIAGAL
jgi:hypothetical protein